MIAFFTHRESDVTKIVSPKANFFSRHPIEAFGNWFYIGNEGEHYLVPYSYKNFIDYADKADLIIVAITGDALLDYEPQISQIARLDKPKIFVYGACYANANGIPPLQKERMNEIINGQLFVCHSAEEFYYKHIFDNVMSIDERYRINIIKSHYQELEKNFVLIPLSYGNNGRYSELNAIISSELSYPTLMLRANNRAIPTKYSNSIIPLPHLSKKMYYHVINLSFLNMNIDHRFIIGKASVDCACLKVPHISFAGTNLSKVLWKQTTVPEYFSGEEIVDWCKRAIRGEFQDACEEAYDKADDLHCSIGRQKIMDYFGIEDF